MMNERTTNFIARGTQRAAHVLALALALLLLAGCETIAPSGQGASELRAQRLLDDGRYEDAAGMYVALAGERSGEARDDLILRAARAYLLAGDAARAARAVSQVSEPVPDGLRNDWLIIRAEIAVLEARDDEALSLLDELGTDRLTLLQRVRAESVRGRAFFGLGQPVQAIRILQRRELWLGSDEEIEGNHTLIWDGLLASDPIVLREAFAQTDDPVLRGWLSLGMLADGTDPRGPVAGIAAWRRDYPGHPALAYIVPGLTGDTSYSPGYPQQIALLLTLTGRFGSVGEAIRDGFLGAYAQQMAGRVGDDVPSVRVYDISETGVIVAYEQAVADGAGFVVGPLVKSAVSELASFGRVTVPTLTLNYLAETELAPPGMMQFGLAPEDEAAAVARRAFAEGHRRAVALVPQSDWGDRVLQAFAREFERIGGRMMSYESYLTEQTDFAGEIQRLMLLDDSFNRYRRIRTLVGPPLQHEARRRQDIDFIFLAANEPNGIQMKPQLGFHYAGDLPVFATSVIHNQRSEPVGDLRGIRFPEIPWVLDDGGRYASLRTLYADYWPASRARPRLYALGYDAFSLVGAVTADQAGDAAAFPLDGATGVLSMTGLGRVTRELPFAVFTRDGVEALPVLEPPATVGSDVGIVRVAPRTDGGAPARREQRN